MEDLWYEEELVPEPEILRGDEKRPDEPRLKIMVGQVRWKPLGKVPLQTREPGHLYLVRLRFQFVAGQATIVYAKCSAFLWSALQNSGQPVVYDMYPTKLIEGKPKNVQVQLGPELKMGGVEASIGSITSDITVGRVHPKVVGYPGDNESAPYWEIYPMKGESNLEGILDFWLAVETPPDSHQFTLAVMAEATAQFKRRFFVRPEKKAWDMRPKVIIG